MDIDKYEPSSHYYASLFSGQKARTSHQYSHYSILLWQQKQPAPLVANTRVNTNRHRVTFFHPFHFMFYTWLQRAAVHQAKVAQSTISYMQLTVGFQYFLFFLILLPDLSVHKRKSATWKRPTLVRLGLAEVRCSCLCEMRCERALIISRAESETHTAYIIEEHIVKEEVVLKHEITSALTSHSQKKESADSELTGGSLQLHRRRH